MGKTAIIDADSIIYIVAWNNKDTEDPILVMQQIDEFMRGIVIDTKCDQYLGVFSSSKTFRNRIASDYKANRPPTADWVNKWKSQIVEYCIQEYGFVTAEDMEADDVLCIMQGADRVLCHIDKDLNQIPGEHYNYTKKTIYWVDNTQAVYNFWYQVLVGDTTDNVKGAWKIGPVKASRLLSSIQHPEEYDSSVSALFKAQNGEDWEEDLRKAVSLIRLLQPTPALIEEYKQHIQKVGEDSEPDLVEDILNHAELHRVSEHSERSLESDILCPPADIS